MNTKSIGRLLAALLAFGLIAAACGSSDSDIAENSDDNEESESADEPASTEDGADEETDGGTQDGADEGTDGTEVALSQACPSPLVIQTDWFPETEHGALYQMLGDDYTIDSDNMIVSGPLVAHDDAPTGIDLEIRAGGPAIGFAAPRVQLYTDDAITLAYSNTDTQATNQSELPLLAVMAPLEKNPQMIMWDPEVYPDVSSLADLGESGATINVFGGAGFSDFFVAEGIWSADQVDPSYDGSPARFVADTSIAQQGFASAEPYNYQNVFEEYGREVEFELLHDAGFEIYSQTLTIKPSELDELSPCLELLVPIVQQSVLDFSADPGPTNAVIIDAVTTFDSFWVYDEGIANYAVQTMGELGLHGNGGDDTVGNFDAARIETVLESLKAAGLEVPEDLTAEELFTNDFIDPSIGFQ